MSKINKTMNIILMGPPAAGKGTQSELIVKEYSIPHISTGDMLREAKDKKTKVGLEASHYMDNGLLVPDDVMIKVIEDRLKQKDCQKGFLLDGFPRTVPQAQALDEMLKRNGKNIDIAILLTADDDVLTSRITSRRVCPNCGASYSTISKKPKVEAVCDNCGSSLIQRVDDTEEKFSVRLNAYKTQTFPIASYYREKGLLKEVDALKEIESVFNSVKEILDEVAA